jgi:signal transduction histidine kinase/ligand-binding sensor domain-containing protein/CheY-like chemotaxis protein
MLARPYRACAALVAAALALVLALGAASAAAAPARTLRFEQLSVAQGLAQESVLSVVQDPHGFMWFGTQAGLSRFDGYRVTVYRNEPNDPESLVNNWVRVLLVDRAGRMWVGTDGGLDQFNPATQRFHHYVPAEVSKRGNGDQHLHALVEDGKGGLWIASADGLQHFDPVHGTFRSWHHSAAADSLASDEVNALALDPSGRLWIGTAAGLDSMAPGADRFEHYPHARLADASLASVDSLLVDRHKVLWVGSRGALETRALDAPARVARRFGPAEGLKPGDVTALYEDVDGTVWAGTNSDGLYRWQPELGRFAHFQHLPEDEHSVADNQISALYRDRVGTLWVGTWFAGVSRVDLAGGGFSRLVHQGSDGTSMANNKARGIVPDGQGRLWVGTNGGLELLDPATNEARPVAPDPAVPGLAADPLVNAVARDRHGVVWTGTHFGVTAYDPATGRQSTRSFGGADADFVRYLYFDRSGMLWVATRGGLHRLDPDTGEVRTYRHDPADPASLADNAVRPVLEDRHGRLWVGTFNGLDLLDRETGRFTHYRRAPHDPASLSHDEVHFLLEDHQGTLWVGTADGLNRMMVLPNGQLGFRRYGVADGLADAAVAAILEDDDHDLWISTNSGLTRFEVANKRWRNFSAGDGTIEGAYFDAAAARTADGTLYFGGFNGITGFRPRDIRDNLIAPRAVITDFQIFNKPVSVVRPALLHGPIETTHEITLNASDSVFSLEFSALHFAAPARNRFAYQLEGFDDNWVYADADKRFATYTNLDPGTYTFHVRAANKDGVWSAAGATLRITILPPFWKTWWFRTLALALALGVMGSAYRMRLSGLKRQKDLLAQQVRARTEEIEQQNRRLERQTEELRQRRAEAEQQRAEAERRSLDTERQKEAVELAHRNISTLSEIGRQLTASLDMDTIMATVYRHVHELMDASIFGIGFFNQQANHIEFPFALDHNVRLPVYRRSCENENQFAVWCLNNAREVFVNDREAEYTRYLLFPDAVNQVPTRRVDGTPAAVPHSMMYVPLVVKDRVMGVMCVQSPARQAYQRVHMDMLLTLAAHAAVAFDNARAYRELEDTQGRLLEQERQVRLHTDELALANQALQENDERLRLAKQRAEDATRQKSEFLANMSHEMRTPLAGVIGMLSFALRDPLLQDTTREQILRGQANAQALLTIITDLLDFSKIEAGKLTIENIDFDLVTTIGNVASLFDEQAAAHSVGFDIELATDLPRFVVGDPTRLRQVLVNLVGNAFKFTRDGFVRVTVDRLPDEGSLNMIRFAVHDTGIGIPPDAMGRLFQKFEQADSTTTRRYGGTGLGLAICRQLVELMAGEIGVESTVGVGSIFTFTLPMATGVEPPQVPHVPRQPHSHRLRILCAEDFPTNQIIIRMMLEDFGHRVDVVENGAQAVAACSQNRYDVILMDGRMPEMDGATATRLIRAGGTTDAPVRDQELMIIALTANVSEEDRNRYLGAGMDAFLTKPIDEDKLHFALSRAIERQLQRGIALPLMTEPAPDRAPTTSELDAMFGVVTGPTTLAVAAAQNAGRRASDLKARMRAAFAGDVPGRRADLEAAIIRRDHETAGRLLHGIKGSAAYLEALDLHHLCEELEQAADRQQWSSIEAGMARLRRLLTDFEGTAAGAP